MKNTMKRMLIVMLALVMLGAIALPTALASDGKLVSNATSKMTTYVGLRTVLKVYDKYGYAQDSSDYKWTSSKPSVVSVTSSGVITGKKKGTATITATNRYNKYDKVKAVVTVKNNKVTMRNSRPAPSSWPYKTWGLQMKSIQIVTPTKVNVEYYLVANYPSNWRVSKLKSLRDNIRSYNKSTDSYVSTVVNGYGSTVTGFTPMWGRSVQTIKITFNGAPVYDTNLRLSKYNYTSDPEGVITRTIY